MKRDEIIHLWTKVFWQVYHHIKYNFWYLFQKWHLGAVCNKIFRASKFCLTEFSSQSSMKTLGSNIVFQPDDVKNSTWWGRRFWAVSMCRTSNYNCGQQDLDQVETTRNTTLGLSSEKSTLKQDRTKSPELRRIDLSDTPHTIMWKGFLPISCGIGENVQKSTKYGRRMENNYSFVWRIPEFSILSESPSFGSYSWRHHFWTSIGSSYCENSWRVWDRSCNSINYKINVYIVDCPEKPSGLRFMITKKSSGPVTNCSQNFKDQWKVNHVKKEKEVRVTTKLVLTLFSDPPQRASLCTQRTIPTHEM